MLVTPALRRLLVVDPCDDCHQLLPGLRSAGWAVDSCALDAVGDRSCDVGLLRFQPFHLERPEAVKEHDQSQRHRMDCRAQPRDAAPENVGDFVCEWFFDFHTLPFDVARVQVTLGRAFGMARLRVKHRAYVAEPEGMNCWVTAGQSANCANCWQTGPTESPILIRGESGTGKELVAKTLHRQSQRHAKPFVAINCGAIPEHLIQSELFGHEKGAFTGAHQRKIGRIEAANGGTLFLDEIGDLPMELQANLLRFLQEKHIERVGGGSQPIPVDVRVLAATHVDLEAAIIKGGFAKTCTTGSMCCKCSPHPCVSAMVMWPCWPITLPGSTARKPGAVRAVSARTRCSPWAIMTGRAMCANWPTGCVAAWSWPKAGKSKR
jgi:DNA-binding NtrC family response regulator